MTDTNELRAAIARAGFKNQKLAERLGISVQTLWNKVNNKTEFLASEIEVLSDALDLSTEQRMSIFFAGK